MNSLETFLVIEWEGGSLGHIIGLYSTVEIACEEIKRYFDSPVLILQQEMATYDQVRFELTGENQCVMVDCEHGNQAAIFRLELDKPHP